MNTDADFQAQARANIRAEKLQGQQQLQPKPNGADRSARPVFDVLSPGRYRLRVPSIAADLEVDRLRRDHHELIGELSVRTELPRARTVDGALSIADFNLSSARARQERAKLLAQRSQAKNADWLSIIEELCHRVLAADRAGDPATDLREIARPQGDDALQIEGSNLPRRHPTILFGDGGAAKSYFALFLIGRLAESGKRVALFDWELAGEDHRERLERLFWEGMPRILYARCERPLVYEVDRLSRIVRDGQVEYAVFDSVAFACDGPPEAAEVAGKYFRAVRELGGGGSLHIAHVNKGENADKKPFGSTFWHNGARSTWFAKVTDAIDAGGALTLGLFNRKSNLAALKPPVGFRIQFDEERTIFTRTDVRECPEMAEQMPVRQRMAWALKSGDMESAALATQIGAKEETVTRIAKRYKNDFVVLDGGRLGLRARQS